MTTVKQQVTVFLEKCEELKKCKFIMATTKIKDLLKCIVNSPQLYRLFDTVTKDFNYLDQKSKCLIYVDDGLINRYCVMLPQTVGQRLAFIFCLLVEFDRGTINFNDFLQLYFQEDGSYFASYQAFCRVVISSLEEMIKQVFKEQLYSGESADGGKPGVASSANSERANLISAIGIAVAEEKRFIAEQPMSKEDKEGGFKMLDELLNAVKYGNEPLIDALISGYNYFVLYHKCVSEQIAPLIESLAEYEKVL